MSELWKWLALGQRKDGGLYPGRKDDGGTTAAGVWLDGLASVREISHDPDGPVKAIFKSGMAWSVKHP